MAEPNLSDGIAHFVRQMVGTPISGVQSADIITATWRNAEPVDANLSAITLPGGNIARWVPKLANTVTLSAGDKILVVTGPEVPYTILDKTVGDPTLAGTVYVPPTNDTTPPTAPTSLSSGSPTASTIFLAWGASTDLVGVVAYDVYTSDGVFRGSTTALTATIQYLVPSTSYTFTVKARDAAGNQSPASNSSTTSTLAAAAPPANTTFTLNYAATWSGSYGYKGGNEYNDWFGTQCNQGKFSGGNQKSLIGFNSSQIVADGSGYVSAVNAWITLTYSHWYYNNGGTAIIGTHSNASRPASWAALGDRVRSGGWGRGLRRQVPLGAGIAVEFLSGATKGISLGPGPDGNVIYYGQAYGASSGVNQPVLTVQFVR